jgi:hypothetical protein
VADVRISEGADPGTLAATDKLPLARSASTTAYAATMAEIASYANTAYTPNYSAAPPMMDGTAAPGVAAAVSRGDHIHPSDLTRAPLASPTFTGTPAAPTPTTGDSTTRIATTAFVQAQMVASGAGVSTWNTRAGAVTLQQADVAAVGVLHDDGRNLVHNALFNVAQRGTGPWTTIAYTLDRWLLVVSSDTASFSRTANTTPISGDEAATWVAGMTFTGTATASAVTRLAQPIEDVRRLSAKTVTISFYALCSASQKLGVSIDQYFGTGGSPSATVQGTGQAVTLTTSWARYSLTFAVPSISAKTLGTNNDHATYLNFWYSSGATNNGFAGGIGVQSGTVLMWGIQLEIGSVATPLDYGGSPQQQLAACQRFYQTGWSYWSGYGAASAGIGYNLLFPVTMRAAPTVSYLGTPAGSNASGLAAAQSMPSGFIAQAIATATGAASFNGQFAASADL